MTDLPAQARVVIIGGGVVGCSVAYHLTRLGWTDVVLLERKALTSGTTWHAAGLIGQLRASANMTRLARYSAELYTGLEAETGIATGFRQGGSISVALTVDGLRSSAQRGDGAGLWCAGGGVEPGGCGRALSASQPRWRDGGRLAAHRRAGRPGGYRAGAGQGGADARGAVGAGEGDGHGPRRAARHRRGLARRGWQRGPYRLRS